MIVSTFCDNNVTDSLFLNGHHAVSRSLYVQTGGDHYSTGVWPLSGGVKLYTLRAASQRRKPTPLANAASQRRKPTPLANAASQRR
eukprot:2530191-Pyramimonas_sp.AAC.1